MLIFIREVRGDYSTDSSSQFLLTLASERYTIYFDINLDMSVYKTNVQQICIHCILRELARFCGGPVDT